MLPLFWVMPVAEPVRGPEAEPGVTQTLPPLAASGTGVPSSSVESHPAPLTMSPKPSWSMSPIAVMTPGLRALAADAFRPVVVPG